METGRFARGSLAIAALAIALAGTPAAGGLDPESNTDGFDPAAQSYRTAEARRLNAIARQLDLTYRMQWENPYFPGQGPIRQPIGYESKQLGPDRWIYRPIYAEDVAPPADALPLPEGLPQPANQKAPSAGPQRPAPADAAPEDLIPPKAAPKKPARRAPREF
ncbi:MAG: hypothetical protein WD063_14075 [Pirellulales bacterium]